MQLSQAIGGNFQVYTARRIGFNQADKLPRNGPGRNLFHQGAKRRRWHNAFQQPPDGPPRTDIDRADPKLNASSSRACGCSSTSFTRTTLRPCTSIGVLVDSTTCAGRIWRVWAQEQGLDPERMVLLAHARPPSRPASARSLRTWTRSSRRPRSKSARSMTLSGLRVAGGNL